MLDFQILGSSVHLTTRPGYAPSSTSSFHSNFKPLSTPNLSGPQKKNSKPFVSGHPIPSQSPTSFSATHSSTNPAKNVTILSSTCFPSTPSKSHPSSNPPYLKKPPRPQFYLQSKKANLTSFSIPSLQSTPTPYSSSLQSKLSTSLSTLPYQATASFNGNTQNATSSERTVSPAFQLGTSPSSTSSTSIQHDLVIESIDMGVSEMPSFPTDINRTIPTVAIDSFTSSASTSSANSSSSPSSLSSSSSSSSSPNSGLEHHRQTQTEPISHSTVSNANSTAQDNHTIQPSSLKNKKHFYDYKHLKRQTQHRNKERWSIEDVILRRLRYLVDNSNELHSQILSLLTTLETSNVPSTLLQTYFPMANSIYELRVQLLSYFDSIKPSSHRSIPSAYTSSSTSSFTSRSEPSMETPLALLKLVERYHPIPEKPCFHTALDTTSSMYSRIYRSLPLSIS